MNLWCRNLIQMVVIEKMGIAREKAERAKYNAKERNHKRGIRISCSPSLQPQWQYILIFEETSQEHRLLLNMSKNIFSILKLPLSED